MRKNSFKALFLVAASTFSLQATSAINLDLQGFNGTLIDNKWQTIELPSGAITVQTAKPYTKTAGDESATLSPIVDFNDNSHIHVNGGDGNPGTPTVPFIHGDVGGVFIDGAGSLNNFAFKSMDVLGTSVLQSNSLTHPNATITVRGFKGGVNGMMEGIVEADGVTMKYNGGTQVASTIIDDSFSGTYDFLAADAGFGDVDYVEFFFTDFYRQKPSSMGDGALEFTFDNVMIGAAETAPVPVPAAVWFFGTGLLGLCAARKKESRPT